ncbi:MAG: FlgD immunoglobulin-like domain containing protein, partial [bacterium]
EFDWGHSYCKGAWVQHMLRYVLGDTVWDQPGIFFAALRAYGESLKYGNAATEDYRRICERISGLNLEWFFDEWVYNLGYPVYTVGWQANPTDNGWELIVDLTQNNMNGAPQTFHIPVEIKVGLVGGDTIIRYPVSENPQRNRFTFNRQPVDVEFDPNEWILDSHTVTVGVAEMPPVLYDKSILRIAPGIIRRTALLHYTLTQTTTVSINLYESTGRLIKTVRIANQPAGLHHLDLDLTDRTGKRLTAGVYLIELLTGKEKIKGKFLHLD